MASKKTHDLIATEYLYRGHYITRDNLGCWHISEDRRLSSVLYSGNSIDDCTAMIDGVVDGQEESCQQ